MPARIGIALQQRLAGDEQEEKDGDDLVDGMADRIPVDQDEDVGGGDEHEAAAEVAQPGDVHVFVAGVIVLQETAVAGLVGEDRGHGADDVSDHGQVEHDAVPDVEFAQVEQQVGGGCEGADRFAAQQQDQKIEGDDTRIGSQQPGGVAQGEPSRTDHLERIEHRDDHIEVAHDQHFHRERVVRLHPAR